MKEIFSLFNNAYFVYSDTVFDIWLNTTQIMRKETHCCHFMCYSFGLAARDFYMFHPTDRGTYHSLCNTSCGELAGMKNSSTGPPSGINLTIHHTMRGCSTTNLHPSTPIYLVYH